ncbi:MAG: hemolysin family protein [Candidatus Omnitrophota bacterium]
MWQIWVVSILLVLSGLFSASETALFSLSKIQLHRLREKKADKCAVIEGLLNTPRRTLNTILTGNMLVNVMISTIITTTALHFAGERGLKYSFVCTTLLLLVFGELTPKTFGIAYAQPFACFIARPLTVFAKVIFPIRWLWSKVADSFSQLIIGRRYLYQPFLTEEEIRGLVSIGEKEGIVSKEEEQMISTVFDFSRRSVKEIMIPRVDVAAVDVNDDNRSLEQALKASRYSYLPVFKDTIDNVLGVIDAKKYLLSPCPDWQNEIYPVLFVPETKKIEELLLEFQSKSADIAIVTDEYGGTAGLVTIKDILEEIVGEIRDEYNAEEKVVARIDKDTLTVNGKMSLYDLNEELGTHFEAEDAQTVGGLLIHLFGGIPKSGESIRYNEYLFMVDAVRRHRISKVTIRKI